MTADNQLSHDEIRQQVRARWSKAAPAWRQRRESGWRSPGNQMMTERLLDLAQIAPGQQVLDLACGAGDPAFDIANRVGPQGHVLGLDITEPMVEGARDYARRHGIANVEFRIVASEIDLPVPPASVDAVTCRQGLMFMPDPTAALRAWRRALKSGGRVAVSTWGPAERRPFFTLLGEILARHIDLPRHDDGPGSVFELATPEVLARLFTEAGFTGIETDVFEATMIEAESPEAWWEIVTGRAGPAVDALASVSDEQRWAIRDDAIQTVRGMFPIGPVRIGAEVVVAAGVNPT